MSRVLFFFIFCCSPHNHNTICTRNTTNNTNETEERNENETRVRTMKKSIYFVRVRVCAETVLCYSFHKQGRILRGFSRFARMSYSRQIRHHQNLAKRRTSAIRAKLKAESSKRFGSCKAIFSTSMASLIDGDKVAERDAWVVNTSSSTLMLSLFAKLD